MKKIIKVSIISVVTFFLIGAAVTTYAEEVGRYQAIALSTEGKTKGAFEVLILDTKEGHMWVWTYLTAGTGERNGGITILYSGKVAPGKQIGTIIDQIRWPLPQK